MIYNYICNNFRDLAQNDSNLGVPMGDISIKLIQMDSLQGAQLYRKAGRDVWPVLKDYELEWHGENIN